MNTVTDPSLEPLGFAPHEPEPEALDLVRYWRAVNRNKWRIAALVAAITLLTVQYAFSLKPIYRATAVILIEQTRQRVVSTDELFAAISGSSRDYFLTQSEILKSRDLAEKLVKRMKLVQHPGFNPPAPPPPWYSSLLPEGLVTRKAAEKPNLEMREQGLIDEIAGGISVQPVRNTQLVRLTFESQDPELAASVPNMLASVYITADLEARTESTRRAMSFLTEQSANLKTKLGLAEQALQEYREREKIIDAKNVSMSGASRQLEDLTTSLVEARRKRADAETLQAQVSAAVQSKSAEAVETLPVVQRHPQVQKYKEAEAEAERKLNEASKRYGPEHARMLSATVELKAAQEALRRQINVVVQSVPKELEAARASESAIERALEKAKGDIQGFNRKEFQLAALEREVQTSRQLYDLFLQRSKETNIGDMQSTIARVIDPALVPGAPAGPNKRGVVMTAAFFALLFAVAMALLLERLDNTVKTSHAVEQRLETAAVGVLQSAATESGAPLERLFLDDNQNAFCEAIRTIRSGVLLSGLDSPQKTVLLTSSVPEEGKTTVAANLAFALSQVKKTLLVDADMRRPKIGRILNPDADQLGLSELVAGVAPMDKCIHAIPGSSLKLLPSGKVPPNPLELLSSHSFAATVEKLKQEFEVIVFDSPPVQLVSDALVLAQVATAVLYVVKADATPYPLARQGLKRLRRANAPLLGVILNQLDLDKADRYYGEYSGHGSRYYKKYGYYGKS
jgi:capsular exopolysaccharide synthesis family protein